MARKKRDPLRRRRRGKVKLTQEQKLKQRLWGEAFTGTIDGFRCGFATTKLGKIDICVFRAGFAAKHYFDMMVADDELEWVSDEHLETDSGITIKGDRLRDIAELDMARVERDLFSLSEDYKKRVQYIRSSRPYIAPPPDTMTRRKRNSRRGMILAKTLANELGMNPREFRSKLRRMGIQKPERGWAWRTQEEADRMKALVRLGHNRVVSVDFSRARKDEDSV